MLDCQRTGKIYPKNRASQMQASSDERTWWVMSLALQVHTTDPGQIASRAHISHSLRAWGL